MFNFSQLGGLDGTRDAVSSDKSKYPLDTTFIMYIRCNDTLALLFRHHGKRLRAVGHEPFHAVDDERGPYYAETQELRGGKVFLIDQHPKEKLERGCDILQDADEREWYAPGCR